MATHVLDYRCRPMCSATLIRFAKPVLSHYLTRFAGYHVPDGPFGAKITGKQNIAGYARLVVRQYRPSLLSHQRSSLWIRASVPA